MNAVPGEGRTAGLYRCVHKWFWVRQTGSLVLAVVECRRVRFIMTVSAESEAGEAGCLPQLPAKSRSLRQSSVAKRLRVESGVLLRGDTQLVVEGVMPDLLHVIPVGHNAVLDGVLQ